MQHVVTVQPFMPPRKIGGEYSWAELRLRGKWVGNIFKPGTVLQITQGVQDGHPVIILQESQAHAKRLRSESPLLR